MNEQHKALLQFPNQIETSVAHYKPHGYRVADIRNILVCGLGGSGIGGRIVKSLYADKSPVPIECVSDYTLPEYAGENSLVILNSYSGNTEETLSAWNDAKERNCRIIMISSGGEIEKTAAANHIPFNKLEGGFQPRMALGFSLTTLVLVMDELTGLSHQSELIAVAEQLKNVSVYQDEAKAIFESIRSKLKNKMIVLTDPTLEPVGLRFAQQIQENAKHECFQHTLPEMNHNVVETYIGQLESIFFLLDSQRNKRISARFEFITNLLEVEHNKVVTIPVDDSSLSSIYQLIHLLDWLSLYVADFKKVDSLNVPIIASLKEFLESASE